jgi:uncharacterized cupredoxin-like copper-binding protein
MYLSRPPALVCALGLAGVLSACGQNASGTPTTYDVKAGDSSCKVEQTQLPAGTATFDVENVGSNVTEVYVYGKDGGAYTKIMGEKENIGPGTSQHFEVTLPAGTYQVACKPGMTGDGIRTTITVTGSGGSKGGASAQAESGYDRELEVEVGANGKVELPQDTTGKVGERVELVIDNHSSTEHYLELTGPDGSLGKAEAPAGGHGSFVAALGSAGKYQLKVYAEHRADQASTLTLDVAK